MRTAQIRRGFDSGAAVSSVLTSSRDDTLPLVSLDALSGGRILACTPTTGTAAYLTDGVDGFVSKEATALSISAMLSTALSRRGDRQAIGASGAATFQRSFSIDRFAEVVLGRIEQIRTATPVA